MASSTTKGIGNTCAWFAYHNGCQNCHRRKECDDPIYKGHEPKGIKAKNVKTGIKLGNLPAFKVLNNLKI